MFLGDQLQAVGQRLQPAELPADARRAETILNTARDLAFEPDKDQGADSDEVDDQCDVNERGNNIADGAISRDREPQSRQEPVELVVDSRRHSKLP